MRWLTCINLSTCKTEATGNSRPAKETEPDNISTSQIVDTPPQTFVEYYIALKRGGGGGDGEMAQQLRALTAFPKVLSSNPSNHMVAHNHP